MPVCCLWFCVSRSSLVRSISHQGPQATSHNDSCLILVLMVSKPSHLVLLLVSFVSENSAVAELCFLVQMSANLAVAVRSKGLKLVTQAGHPPTTWPCLVSSHFLSFFFLTSYNVIIFETGSCFYPSSRFCSFSLSAANLNVKNKRGTCNFPSPEEPSRRVTGLLDGELMPGKTFILPVMVART